MKEKNVIRLPENNVGGGGVENNPGWGFSNKYFKLSGKKTQII